MFRSYLRLDRLVVLSALIANAISAASQAQAPPEPWTSPHFSADAKALYQAASAVAVPDGANVTELCDDETYTFDDAGRLVHVGHFIYKIQTQKGAEGWDSLTVGWEPWREARPIIRARVIAPDFTVHQLDTKTITEAPARGGEVTGASEEIRSGLSWPGLSRPPRSVALRET